MSFRLVTLAFSKRFGSQSQKLVAIKLADCANDDGSRVYPSIDTIAAETEICRRKVYGVLADFRRRGLVIVDAPGGGRRKSTRYRINLPAWKALPDAGQGEAADSGRPGDGKPESTSTETGSC